MKLYSSTKGMLAAAIRLQTTPLRVNTIGKVLIIRNVAELNERSMPSSFLARIIENSGEEESKVLAFNRTLVVWGDKTFFQK